MEFRQPGACARPASVSPGAGIVDLPHQAWLRRVVLSYQLRGHQQVPVCTPPCHAVCPVMFPIFPSLPSGRPKDSYSLAWGCFPVYPVVQVPWRMLPICCCAKTWHGDQPRPIHHPSNCQQGLPRQLFDEPQIARAGPVAKGPRLEWPQRGAHINKLRGR